MLKDLFDLRVNPVLGAMGFSYLGCCTFLTNKALGLEPVPDLTSMGIMFGGMATGLGAIVWGHVSKAKNGGK